MRLADHASQNVFLTPAVSPDAAGPQAEQSGSSEEGQAVLVEFPL